MNSTARIFLYGATRAADVGHDLLGVERRPRSTTNAFGTSPASSSGHADHRGVGDRRMAQQNRLELGRRDLHPLVLDQLLQRDRR